MRLQFLQLFAFLVLIQISISAITPASENSDTDGIEELEKLATKISQQFAQSVNHSEVHKGRRLQVLETDVNFLNCDILDSRFYTTGCYCNDVSGCAFCMTNKPKDWEVCFECSDQRCISCQKDCSCVIQDFDDLQYYRQAEIENCQNSGLAKELAKAKNLDSATDILKINSQKSLDFLAAAGLYLGQKKDEGILRPLGQTEICDYMCKEKGCICSCYDGDCNVCYLAGALPVCSSCSIQTMTCKACSNCNCAECDVEGKCRLSRESGCK